MFREAQISAAMIAGRKDRNLDESHLRHSMSLICNRRREMRKMAMLATATAILGSSVPVGAQEFYPRYAYDPGYHANWSWGSSANVGLSFAAYPTCYDSWRHRRSYREGAYVSFGLGDRGWDSGGWNGRRAWAW